MRVSLFLIILTFLTNDSALAQRAVRARRQQKPNWCQDLGIQNCMTALGGTNETLMNFDNSPPESFLPTAWAEHIRQCRADRRTGNVTSLALRQTTFSQTHHLGNFLKSLVIVPSNQEQNAHLSLTKPARLVIDCRGAHLQISQSVFSTRCPVTLGQILQNVAALSTEIQQAVDQYHTRSQNVMEAQYCVDCLSQRSRNPRLNLHHIRWEAAHGHTEVALGGDRYSPPFNYITQSCHRRAPATETTAAATAAPAGESAVELPEIEGFNNAVNNFYGYSASDSGYWNNVWGQLNTNVAFGYYDFNSNYGNYWSSNSYMPRNYSRTETRRMFSQWQSSQRRWQRSRQGREYTSAWRRYQADQQSNQTQTTFQDPTAMALQGQITSFVTRANNCMRDLCECSKTGELRNAISDGMQMHAPLATSYAIEATMQIHNDEGFETRCAPPAEDTTSTESGSTADDENGI